MSKNAIIINEDNFESKVINSTMPVLLDFWAEWCGPCKMLSPAIDAIADKYLGKVVVGKVNVDDSSKIGQKYGIRGIPTLLFFNNGEVQEQIVGNVSESEISDKLDEIV